MNEYQYCPKCDRRVNKLFFSEGGITTPHKDCCYCRGLYSDGSVIPEYEPEDGDAS